MRTHPHFLSLIFLLLAGQPAISAINVYPVATNTGVINLTAAIASSGSNFLTAIISDTNECVQLLSTNGNLIGTLTQVGQGTSFPLLAYGGGNYLMYWDNNFIGQGGVYGQIIAPNGNPVGSPFSIGFSGAPSGGIGTPRALASDGTNFLAVWWDGTNNLYGQRFTSSGGPGGAAFVAANTAVTKEAALAFGKTNYLLAWQTQNDPAITYGALISPSGTASAPFQISQISSPSHNPLAVAFDGTNFLVVWNRDLNPSSVYTGSNSPPPAWNLDGRFVSQSGVPVGSEFTMFNQQTLVPSLAFDGSNYLLCAGFNLDLSTTNKNVLFQFFDRTGSAIGPVFTPFPTLSGTNTPLLGGCAFNGSKFAAGATIGSVGVNPSGGLTGFYSASDYAVFIPSSYAAPNLATGNRINSQFSLTLTGTPGINYVLQMASNLPAGNNWTALSTNSPTNGTVNLTDSNATNRIRFYRAMKQ